MEKRSDCQMLPVGKMFDYKGITQRFLGWHFVHRQWWWPQKSGQVLKLTELQCKK